MKLEFRLFQVFVICVLSSTIASEASYASGENTRGQSGSEGTFLTDPKMPNALFKQEFVRWIQNNTYPHSTCQRQFEAYRKLLAENGWKCWDENLRRRNGDLCWFQIEVDGKITQRAIVSGCGVSSAYNQKVDETIYQIVTGSAHKILFDEFEPIEKIQAFTESRILEKCRSKPDKLSCAENYLIAYGAKRCIQLDETSPLRKFGALGCTFSIMAPENNRWKGEFGSAGVSLFVTWGPNTKAPTVVQRRTICSPNLACN